MCVCVCVCVRKRSPTQERKHARGANHHSFFGVFEIKKVFSKGCCVGLSAECKKHNSHGDRNDCARTVNYSASMGEDAIIHRLRMWLSVGASLEEECQSHLSV